MVQTLRAIRQSRAATRQFDFDMEHAARKLADASMNVGFGNMAMAAINLRDAEVALEHRQVLHTINKMSGRASRKRGGVYSDRKALLSEVKREVQDAIEGRRDETPASLRAVLPRAVGGDYY